MEFSKDDLVQGLVNAALGLKAGAAAEMLHNLVAHDPETANAVGRWIAKVDADFGKRVFDRLARLQTGRA